MTKKLPNIVLFFADDLGIGDVSIFNKDSKLSQFLMVRMIMDLIIS